MFITFHAMSDIHIGSDVWKGFTESDGSGIYFDLIKKVYTKEPLKFHLSPFSRVKNTFNNEKLDVLLGVYPEDIHNKVLPSWPLDQERPIVAFYDSRKVNFKHISDIETVSTSWKRGYNFEKFLPLTRSNYNVNTPASGFKLLLGGRVDAFIDYTNNQPKDLPSYIKTFQLMPSRMIYAAFQRNVRGKKLAATFDLEMAKLMQSGELAKIYGEYYNSSGLDKYLQTKTEVMIHTDERDLLGDNNLELTKSHSSLYQVAMLLDEQLPAFNFSYQRLSSVEKVLNNKQNVKSITCVINALKNPERERNYVFSSPVSLYQGLRLYSTTKLQPSGAVNLSKILNQNPLLKLGIHTGRSYETSLDRTFKTISKTQVFSASSNEVASIKQLHKNRFDLLIESPIVFEHYWKQVSQNKKIFSYQLASTRPYITGHLVCNKSKATDIFIDKANAALQALYQTGIFYKAQKSLTKDFNKEEFLNAYIENFN